MQHRGTGIRPWLISRTACPPLGLVLLLGCAPLAGPEPLRADGPATAADPVRETGAEIDAEIGADGHREAVDAAETARGTESDPASNPASDPASDPAPGAQSTAPKPCWAPAPTQAPAQDLTQPPEAEAALAARRPVGPSERLTTNLNAGWFETPCPDVLTPDFVAMLQRALAARGFYTGPATGEMDAATRAAIAAYQSKGGLMSDTLSVAAARQLGLIAVQRPQDD